MKYTTKVLFREQYLHSNFMVLLNPIFCKDKFLIPIGENYELKYKKNTTT